MEYMSQQKSGEHKEKKETQIIQIPALYPEIANATSQQEQTKGVQHIGQ
jgi:hypothetical protein